MSLVTHEHARLSSAVSNAGVGLRRPGGDISPRHRAFIMVTAPWCDLRHGDPESHCLDGLASGSRGLGSKSRSSSLPSGRRGTVPDAVASREMVLATSSAKGAVARNTRVVSPQRGPLPPAIDTWSGSTCSVVRSLAPGTPATRRQSG